MLLNLRALLRGFPALAGEAPAGMVDGIAKGDLLAGIDRAQLLDGVWGSDSYVDERTDGFRILIRDSPASITSGSTYSTLLNEAVNQVSSILAGDFSRRGLDADMAPLYAQALVGSVSMAAQWWLDVREPKKEVVAAHLVNLCWNGLMHLEDDPPLLDE